eukprot:460934_1
MEQDTLTDSTYLLENKAYIGQNDGKCALKQCICLERLSTSLKIYHQFMIDIDNNSSSEFDFRDRFDCIVVLNDSNHLLYHHSTEFEDICNILIDKSNNKQVCKLSNCRMMRRNHRNRSEITSNENLLSDIYYGHDITT